MSLSGPLAKQLEEAMQSAYDYAGLKRFVTWTLEKKLEPISLGGSLEEVLFELIERARREGWDDRLVAKVCEDKPDSPEVASFCQSYKPSPANHQSPASADEELVSRSPAIHNLPLSPLGPLFRGRDALLEQLARDLEADPTALTQHQALHGLGGIGKTRLAVEYAWRSGERYDAVFFVGAGSPEDLRRNLTELGARDLLDLELGAVSEEEGVRAVLAELRTRPRWLMILDNVDTEEAAKAVRQLLPRLSGGHVLVTSRLASWPSEIRKPVPRQAPDPRRNVVPAGPHRGTPASGHGRYRRSDEPCQTSRRTAAGTRAGCGLHRHPRLGLRRVPPFLETGAIQGAGLVRRDSHELFQIGCSDVADERCEADTRVQGSVAAVVGRAGSSLYSR